MIFRALAKNVKINGRTRMLTPPITPYNQKNAITERMKRIQYRPLLFFVFSIWSV